MTCDIRQFTRAAAALVLTFGVAACGGDAGDDDRAVLTLQGDTIVQVVTKDYPGGVQTAECAFVVRAVASGPENMGITIMQGQITYMLAATGDTVIARPVDAGQVGDFFNGAVSLKTGSELSSTPQGISMSIPVSPMRGSVTFDYMEDNAAQSRTTEPFTFTCR